MLKARTKYRKQVLATAKLILCSFLSFALVMSSLHTSALAEAAEAVLPGSNTTYVEAENTGDKTTIDTTEDASAADESLNTDATSDPNSDSETVSNNEDIHDTATVESQDDLYTLTLSGEATTSEEKAKTTLAASGYTLTDELEEALDEHFAPSFRALAAIGELPSSGGGNQITNLHLSWMTPDSAPARDGGSADYLYVKPADDQGQTIRMRLNYELSGEKNYAAGALKFYIPRTIFPQNLGVELNVPVPEWGASEQTNWGYVYEDDYLVIINRTEISAATSGFFELGFSGITPHTVRDMYAYGPMNVRLEASVENGPKIGAKSNDLQVAFDTWAKVDAISIEPSIENGEAKLVEFKTREELLADEQLKNAVTDLDIPEYVVVNWFVQYHVNENSTSSYSATTKYTVADSYGGVFGVNGKTELQYPTIGFRRGNANFGTISVVYPLSVFTNKNSYEFGLSASTVLEEADASISTPDGTDPKEVSSVEATKHEPWTFDSYNFVEPTGHFNVFKYGNDHDEILGGGYVTHEVINAQKETTKEHSDIGDNGDNNAAYNGYFGRYPGALNVLNSGETKQVSYTLNTVGYMLPWTYEKVYEPAGSNPLGLLENYNQLSVRMETVDTGLYLDKDRTKPLTPLVDYTYVSYEFAGVPTIYKATQVKLDANGNVVMNYVGDGTVTYEKEVNPEYIDDITLSAEVGGNWIDVARASWKSGSLSITNLQTGSQEVSNVVSLPEGTTRIKTSVSSKNAGYVYTGRVNVELNNQGLLGSTVSNLLNTYVAPKLDLWNGTEMRAYDYKNTELVKIDKNGFDRLYGYRADEAVSLKKDAELISNNTARREVRLRYSATLDKQSLFSDKNVYDEAVATGYIKEELAGTWYDLLPKGMKALTDTIKLRSGDEIKDVQVIENYKNSGRDLLIIKAKLKPHVGQKESLQNSGASVYSDTLSMNFEAIYSYNSIDDFGATTHNIVAYESAQDSFGSIDNYKAENDDPYGTNNIGTKDAFESSNEKAIMDNLDPERDTQSFLYAGRSFNIDILREAQNALTKEVMTNNDGYWSTGVENGDETLARDVYAGSNYTYRIGLTTGPETKNSDLIFYDSLENFSAQEGNDPADIGAARFKGSFAGIDVSSLIAQGINPKIYYSSVSSLRLDNGASQRGYIEANTDLSNSAIWKPWDESVDPSTVTAIAVDARLKQDGSQYELAPAKSLGFRIYMRAPSGSSAAAYIEQDAHAYNNVYLHSRITQVNTSSSETTYIRKDYTKVGLENYKVSVTKTFDDANNNDNIRPDEVQVKLYADGRPAEEVVPGLSPEDTTATLSAQNRWQTSFNYLPYRHDDGTLINYRVVEQNIADGYSASYSGYGDRQSITNVHVPETIRVEGTKSWIGDIPLLRPKSIKVNLYKNDELIQTKEVWAKIDGSWTYSFDNLPKYTNGVENIYRCEEDSSTATDYIHTQDGNNLINTYHPFGDLSLHKDVVGASEASADKSFTFSISLKTISGIPAPQDLNYEIVDENENVISTGIVRDGSTISLKDNETLHIHEVPSNLYYEFSEVDIPAGFTTHADNAKGKVAPNTETTATFTNTYKAEAWINLAATKKLVGKKLEAGKFKFELVDSEGKLVAYGFNDAEDTSYTDEEGNNVSVASVPIYGLTFNAQDHGKTYRYTLREAQFGLVGYTYSADTYIVEVSVIDNGDGTLSTSTRYFAADGTTEIENPQDTDKGIVFTNVYEPKAEYQPFFYKQLKGAVLQDAQFSFTLDKIDMMEDGTTTATTVQTKTNDSSGKIGFDPLVFTYKDVGKTYFYAVREVEQDDQTIEYDQHVALIKIEVIETEEGRIGIKATDENLSISSPYKSNETVSSTIGSNVFKNSKKPGSLTILKDIGPYEDMTSKHFRFKVELLNEDGLPLDINVEDRPEAPVGTASEPLVLPNVLDLSRKSFTSTTVLSSGKVNSADSQSATYTIYTDGRMVIDATGGKILRSQTATNPARPSSNFVPGYYNQLVDGTIKAIEFVPGSVAGADISQMFRGYPGQAQLEWFDGTNLNVTNTKFMSSTFSQVYAKLIDLSTWRTPNLTIANHMFMNDADTINGFVGTLRLDNFDLTHIAKGSAEDMFQNYTNYGLFYEVYLGPNFYNPQLAEYFYTPSPRTTESGTAMVSYDFINVDTGEVVTDFKSLLTTRRTGITHLRTPSTGTLTINANGGYFPYSSITRDFTGIYKNYDLYSFPDTLPVRDGYIFDGWLVTKTISTNYNNYLVLPGKSFSWLTGTEITAQWVTASESIQKQSEGVYIVSTRVGIPFTISNSLPVGTRYRITELGPESPEEDGLQWALESSSNTSGVIASEENSQAHFVNETVSVSRRGTAHLQATKLLNGRPASAGYGFEFELTETTPGATTPLHKIVQADAAGVADFGEIVYKGTSRVSKAGTYTYQIREIPGSDPNIQYDMHVQNVTVTVTNGLTATDPYNVSVVYDGLSEGQTPTFNNTQKKAKLEIEKKVSSPAGYDGMSEFKFVVHLNGELYKGSYYLQGDSSTALETTDGTITLQAGQVAVIEGLDAGTSYDVNEDLSETTNWSIESEENVSGVLGVGQTARAVVTNKNTAQTFVEIIGQKHLQGGVPTAGQFSFKLYNRNNNDQAIGEPIAEATIGTADMRDTVIVDGSEIDNPNYGSASFTFPKMNFSSEDLVGYPDGRTYTYLLREDIPADAVNSEGVAYKDATAEDKASGLFTYNGIQYSPEEKFIDVTLNEDKNGELVAFYNVVGSRNDSLSAVEYPTGSIDFTNRVQTYRLTLTKVVDTNAITTEEKNRTFEVTLHLTNGLDKPIEGQVRAWIERDGQKLQGSEISFNDQGATEQTFMLKADDKIVVDGVPKDARYQVKEQNLAAGWSINETTSSKLEGTIQDNTNLELHNKYEAAVDVSLKAAKYFEGKISAKQFSWMLADNNEGTEAYETRIQEATNDALGNVSFEPLHYTTEDAGKTFHYQMFEINKDDPNVLYDDRVVDVSVTITDVGGGKLEAEVLYDGAIEAPVFKNRLREGIAKAGANGVGLGGLVVLIAGLGYYYFRRKKK